MPLRLYICLFLFFMLAYGLKSQHNPIITYYASADYGAHHQNWSIAENQDGEIFSANTYGLLHSNGNVWNVYTLPSKKIIRSVYSVGRKIFTGSHGDVGYWQKDSCQIFHYTSLLDKIPSGLIQNEEIWNIRAEGENLWFQSFSVLLKYTRGQFQQIKLPGSIMFLQITPDKKLIPVLDHGIFEIDGSDEVSPWPGGDFFKEKIVTGIVQTDPQTYLIATNDHGIYSNHAGTVLPWHEELSGLFSKIQINRMLWTKNKQLVIGTINGGIYIFSAQGKLKHHMHSGNGLHNNTVLSLSEDGSGNVWAGLDKGLAKIHLSTPDMAFKDTYGTLGSVYTTCEHEGLLYLGTNQGLYSYDSSEEDFVSIPGTQGQCWQVFTMGKNLYCGHNDGLFIIESKKARLISPITGGWYQEALPGTDDRYWLQGNYTGLALFEFKKDNLHFLHQLDGFSLPVKKFIQHKNKLWVTSPNNGLFQIILSEDKKNITSSMAINTNFGLPNAHNSDIYVFDDTLRVNTGTQHFYYDETNKKFSKDEFFASFSGPFLIRPLRDRQWLMIFQDLTVRMDDNIWRQALPVVMNRDYHNVNQFQGENYILCTDDGYYIIPKWPTESPKKTNIDIQFTSDGQNCIPFDNSIIPGGESAFIIHFADQDFVSGKNYQYRILPVQQEWKPTHTKSSISITQLKPGEYTLEILRHDGVKASKNFLVQPPWYQCWPARILYVLLGFSLLYFVKKYYDSLLEKANRQHQFEQDRLIKEHEMELENQRLSHENMVKNKELANSALQLVHKNETLQEIKKELIEIRKSSHHVLTTQDFQILMKQINENLNVRENQKLFDDSFEEVNKQFFTSLIQAYPDISKEDLKLAAYIKMDLTSKEIAPLLNLSLRGLENKRYRLRKKLNIPGEENLTSFFRNLERKA